MSNSEIFLIAIAIIFTVPYLIWRVAARNTLPAGGRADHHRHLMGPGILGAALPGYYRFVFNRRSFKRQRLAWWAVMVFVWIAGIELDLKKAWQYRRDGGITAGLALGVRWRSAPRPAHSRRARGLDGPRVQTWQFILGWHVLCGDRAADPDPVPRKARNSPPTSGQRILRYASFGRRSHLGACWPVISWTGTGRQAGGFLLAFAVAAIGFAADGAAAAERPRLRWD